MVEILGKLHKFINKKVYENDKLPKRVYLTKQLCLQSLTKSKMNTLYGGIYVYRCTSTIHLKIGDKTLV